MNKVRVLVDAEYTYMNPALSLVTMAMMKKFNKDGAWIWNTYQCYLKVNIAHYKEHRAGWCCVVIIIIIILLFPIRSLGLLCWKLCACLRWRGSVWV